MRAVGRWPAAKRAFCTARTSNRNALTWPDASLDLGRTPSASEPADTVVCGYLSTEVEIYNALTVPNGVKLQLLLLRFLAEMERVREYVPQIEKGSGAEGYC